MSKSLFESLCMQDLIHVPTAMVDVLIFACSVLPTLMATLVHVTVALCSIQMRQAVLQVNE